MRNSISGLLVLGVISFSVMEGSVNSINSNNVNLI